MWVIPRISLLECCIHTLYFPVSRSFFHLDAINLKSKRVKNGNISFSSLLCYRPVSEWFQVPKFGGMAEAERLWWKEPISPFSSGCVPSRDRCGWPPVALCGWVFLVTRLVSAGLRRRDFKLTLRKEVVTGKGFLLLLLLLFQRGTYTYIHPSQEQWSRAGRVLENSPPGEQKAGLTGKHPCIVHNWGADWDAGLWGDCRPNCSEPSLLRLRGIWNFATLNCEKAKTAVTSSRSSNDCWLSEQILCLL